MKRFYLSIKVDKMRMNESKVVESVHIDANDDGTSQFSSVWNCEKKGVDESNSIVQTFLLDNLCRVVL